MDPITQQAVLATAGAGGSDLLYVDDVFSTYLYEGTGSAQTITNGIDISGEGGLVWIKNRENQYQDHALYDTERGAGQTLDSATTNAQFLSTNRLSALNSDGFTVGGDTATNESGKGIVSWSFRKAPGFFDVVTWTGDGTNPRTISHNLGSVPGSIWMKRTDTADSKGWIVYHRSLGTDPSTGFPNQFGKLNSSAAPFSDSGIIRAVVNSTTTISVSSDVNASGGTYVAYFFAHDEPVFGTNEDESIIKCGSYTGNSGSAGPDVNVGFEPQWVLIKNASSGGNDWRIFDNMRGVTTGGNDQSLCPNRTDAEDSGNNYVRDYLSFTSTGFTLGTTGDNSTDYNGDTHIYMAIRRPHKPPTAATEVFMPMAYTGNGSSQAVAHNLNTASGLMTWFRNRNTSLTDPVLTDTIRGPKWRLSTNLASQEYAYTPYLVDAYYNNYYDVLSDSQNNKSGSSIVAWNFKRAPGFFDIVAYTGNGIDSTMAHNLGVIPEMIVVKNRSSTSANWAVYHASAGITKEGALNTDAAFVTGTMGGYGVGSIWYTNQHATVFYVSNDIRVNSSGDNYVAYLFATLAGISKVGSYSGTGNAINVDCGFSSGARFILIKRSDSTGDWFVYDTARGIVSGNDPYILINTNSQEVTNTDYIDPLNSGFTVTSSAPTGLNASGGTYIFLAIA